MSTPANTPFTVVAEIRDPDGDVCANGEADVPCVISLDNIPSGSEGAVLSGTTTKTPVNGVLTFDDLEIDLEGVGYTLKVQTVTPIDIYPVGTGSLVAKISSAITVVDSSHTLTAVDFIFTSSSGVDRVGMHINQDAVPTNPGSVSPTTFSTKAIRSMHSAVNQGAGNITFLSFTSGTELPQDFFTSITVGAVTLLSADAGYIGGPNTSWYWSDVLFPTAGTYSVTLA